MEQEEEIKSLSQTSARNNSIHLQRFRSCENKNKRKQEMQVFSFPNQNRCVKSPLPKWLCVEGGEGEVFFCRLVEIPVVFGAVEVKQKGNG